MFSLYLRLAIMAILRLEPGSLGILAPVCSSMGFLTASQSMRSFVQPLGVSHFDWVRNGNILAVRPLLLNHMIGFEPPEWFSYQASRPHEVLGYMLLKVNFVLEQPIRYHSEVNTTGLAFGIPWPLLPVGAALLQHVQILPSMAILLQIHLRSNLTFEVDGKILQLKNAPKCFKIVIWGILSGIGL